MPERTGPALILAGDAPPYRPPSEPAATVSTAAAFEAWLGAAHKGDRVVYHRGHIAADREAPGKPGRRVRATADFVYLHSDMDTPHMSRCYHVRGWTPGTGKVALSQMRATGGRIVYIAERKAFG